MSWRSGDERFAWEEEQKLVLLKGEERKSQVFKSNARGSILQSIVPTFPREIYHHPLVPATGYPHPHSAAYPHLPIRTPSEISHCEGLHRDFHVVIYDGSIDGNLSVELSVSTKCSAKQTTVLIIMSARRSSKNRRRLSRTLQRVRRTWSVVRRNMMSYPHVGRT